MQELPLVQQTLINIGKTDRDENYSKWKIFPT